MELSGFRITADCVGIFISSLGLLITIVLLLKTQKAAQAAKQATESTRSELVRRSLADSLKDVAAAIDQAQRYVEAKSATAVSDQLVLAAQHIARSRGNKHDLTVRQRKVLSIASAMIVEVRTGIFTRDAFTNEETKLQIRRTLVKQSSNINELVGEIETDGPNNG